MNTATISAARTKGFSLIELMIAVAIVGVLASLAGPVMDLMEKRRLASAAKAVYGHLQLARSEAIRQGVDMHLNYRTNGTTTWCLGINNGADCDCTVAAAGATYCGIPLSGSGAEVLQVVGSTDYTNITAPTSSTASPAVTAFTSPVNLTMNYVRGSIAGLGGTEQMFVFKSTRGLELRVAMNILGRVRICSPAAAAQNVAGYAPC